MRSRDHRQDGKESPMIFMLSIIFACIVPILLMPTIDLLRAQLRAEWEEEPTG